MSDQDVRGVDMWPNSVIRDRMPWRPVGTGVIGLGTSIGSVALYPLLGWIVIGIEASVILTVLGTALFGSEALCDRAFRLLRWVANRPEPPAPGVGPSESRPTAPTTPPSSSPAGASLE